MRLSKLAVVLLALVPAVVFAARTAELVDPAPIELTSKASAKQVKRAVKTAVLARGWTIENEKGDRFEAKYAKQTSRDNFWARIAVTHDARRVTIKYVGSEGLSYSDEGGKRVIHANYNKWIGFLVKDIPIYVEREVVASE